MNKFSVFEIFIIIGTSLLLKDLYTSYNHGRNIMKVKKSRGSVIFWLGSLILFCLLLGADMRLYSHYEKDRIIDNISMIIFWIEFSISNMIKSFRGSEIRENGIYNCGYFYKWSKIQSYSWVLPNTIEFKVNTFFKNDSAFKFTINEEFKLKVEEVIQSNLTL